MCDRSVEDAPTFWMNVTTSANWQRSPVGIVRVEQEVRRHLSLMLGDRLRTVVFRDGSFVSEAAASAVGTGDLEDFWPEPSYGSSGDLFDPFQSPAAGGSGVAIDSEARRKPRFRYGDVLITMGLDWEYPGLHDEIRRLARAYNLTVITCCYDLIPVLYPQYCVSDVASWFKNYFIGMAWAADGILCISENTRRDYFDLAQRLGLPPRRAEVIKLGSSLPPQIEGSPVSSEVKQVLDGRYFLFVSTIERRKNHEVLYRAYHLIRQENPDVNLPRLILVGMEGWGVADLLSDIKLDPLTRDDITILSQVSDHELSLLYANCEIFLYPSHYEGWGLPIAEALQLGRPVIASNAGSIPEVGGDLVLYVDPWSPRAWANELLKIANCELDLESWSKRIAEEFQPFDWSTAAETVILMASELRRERPCVQIIEPGYQLSTVNGVHYGSRIIYEGHDGIVCHGPYIELAEGSYEVAVRIDWVFGKSGSLVLAARYNDGGIRVALEKRAVRSLNPGEQIITLAFSLSESVRDFELLFETHCSGKIRLSVDEIVITRLGSNKSRPKSLQNSQVRAA